MSPKGEYWKMSAAVNSITGAQSDLIGRGAGGSESSKESGTSESQVSQGTRSMFGSIAVDVEAPRAASIHRPSIWAIGSGLMAEADSCAATKALFGGRARSCSSQQCGALGCGSGPSKIKSPRISAVKFRLPNLT